MKKKCLFVFIFLALAITILTLPTLCFASEGAISKINLTKNAISSVLADANSGEIVFEKNANEKRPIASMTKIMTLLVVYDAINDGKISYDELAAYNSISNAQKADYNTFFNVMSKYNKQQHRDYTVQLFNRMSESSAYSFLNFCIAVCIVDGNVAYNEESFCTSLCEVYLNRFYY